VIYDNGPLGQSESELIFKLTQQKIELEGKRDSGRASKDDLNGLARVEKQIHGEGDEASWQRERLAQHLMDMCMNVYGLHFTPSAACLQSKTQPHRTYLDYDQDCWEK
jgi:hypothetical protein